ncbi:hypothetical protein Dthio_PD2221 [Desulfonatronospira thiodismutans ASO3-1]|uniref:Uncharacterized protein n=1 Tax=Desulfonatronospira thiodismutans ASO3-1 TaxID=555779 RepID=D6SQ05_9BACT|nr:hypothetical protein Dthio_PD2221 [Desulfonatronospira thiodismutans ASO3-1]
MPTWILKPTVTHRRGERSAVMAAVRRHILPGVTTRREGSGYLAVLSGCRSDRGSGECRTARVWTSAVAAAASSTVIRYQFGLELVEDEV